MISKSEVFPIGKFYKPHGISGEISFGFTNDTFDRTESPYWVLEMDGILVPFFVESYRFRSEETALVRLEGVESEAQAKELFNKVVYYPFKYAEEDDEDPTEDDNWNTFVGFKVYDVMAGYLGEVEEVDDSTLNVLFKIINEGREILMPVAEEFITDINTQKREMHVHLPEGLIEL
ncbi:MAG: ribosome maturation factor RimM [Bacteroidales bacterium]|nr:ribosome maturation factor RimM [Bacteroidales bacterium]